MKTRRWGVLWGLFSVYAVVLAAAMPQQVSAYEIQTHRALSVAALDASTWAKAATPTNLGLALFPYGAFPGRAGLLSPSELVQYGAQHEDDGARPINHFFDPYRSVGLPFAQSSPDWILNGSNVPVYTYEDLLAYLRGALAELTVESRNAYWALVFETLGHVIHHVQDMAQPQHVRGDLHFHRDWPIVGDPSLYEACTEAALLTPPPTRRCGDPLGHGLYPVVRLARAREYWTTVPTDAYGRGRGMADFTNANFVSKDSNFRFIDDHLVLRARDFPSPMPTGLRTHTLEELGASDVCERLRRDPRALGRAASCEIEFASTEVVDAYAGNTETNERAASLSVFDQYLGLRPDGPTYAVDRLFTLNRFNHAAAHEFLIPRAIGYSAGLIDHFFRGRLEAGEVDAQDGMLTVEIKNISAEGNAFGPGTFQLYYDSVSKTRKPLTLESGADLGMQQFAPGQKHVLTARIPGDVDVNAEKPFVIVYSGIIGAEEAVAGLVLEAPPLYEGFLFHANGELADRAGYDRLIYLSEGQWRLHPQGDIPQAGNLDWKGWYVDGRATRVLTWNGPSRYDAQQLTAYRPQIYRDGRSFVVAPCPVLGAALQKDAQSNPWVVAICGIADKDVAYARPAKRDVSPALHDPQSAPDGWRILGEFQAPSEMTPERRPWLFNGDGTEAQTMRILEHGPLTRLKAFITPESAQFSDVGNTQVTHTIERTRDWQCGQERPLNSWTRTRTAGEHVIAADYAGNEEVLARLVVDANTQRHATVNSSDTSDSGSSTSSEDSVWRLEAGSWSVPVFEREETAQTSYSITWTEGQQGEHYGYDREEHDVTNRAHILFWDLRNNTWISSDGNVDLSRDVYLQEDRTLNETITHKANFIRMLGQPARSLVEINRTPVVGAPVTRLRPVNDFRYELAESIAGAFRCDPSATPADPASSLTVEFTATLATLPQPSYPSNMEVMSLAAAATDRNGNFFWSLRYRNGPGLNYLRISRVAGTSVDAITGLGSASALDPPYAPIMPN